MVRMLRSGTSFVLAATVAALLAWSPTSASADTFSWKAATGDKAKKPTRKQRAYARWLKRGDRLAEQALRPTYRRIRRYRITRRGDYITRMAREAVMAYEAAAASDPTKAEPHHRAAELIYSKLISQSSISAWRYDKRPLHRALYHWDQFERKAPLDPRVIESMFNRALVYTKLGDKKSLKKAAAAYDRLARSAYFTSKLAGVGTTLSNLAEVHMMLGNLDESILTYRLALRHDRSPLHAYGLGVALDRDGQGVRARELVHRFVRTDKLASLSASRGVFFVPLGEKNYYLALGHEAMGNLDQAIKYWQRYIASGAHPRYQPRAKSNLRTLLELKRAGKKLPTPGSPESFRSDSTP